MDTLGLGFCDFEIQTEHFIIASVIVKTDDGSVILDVFGPNSSKKI